MLSILTSGRLVADPVQKTGANGKVYALCRIGAATDDGSTLISAIVFNQTTVETVLRLRRGDDIAAVGRAKPSAWLDKVSHEPKAGLDMVIEHVLTPYQIKQRRKPADEEHAPSRGEP